MLLQKMNEIPQSLDLFLGAGPKPANREPTRLSLRKITRDWQVRLVPIDRICKPFMFVTVEHGRFKQSVSRAEHALRRKGLGIPHVGDESNETLSLRLDSNRHGRSPRRAPPLRSHSPSRSLVSRHRRRALRLQVRSRRPMAWPPAIAIERPKSVASEESIIACFPVRCPVFWTTVYCTAFGVAWVPARSASEGGLRSGKTAILAGASG